MKTTRIELSELGEWQRLVEAAHRAARGKRDRPDAIAFFQRFEESLCSVQSALLSGRLPDGRFSHFEIFDPKRRLIHAAPFDDRVAHHAIIDAIGPALDRWQADSSYACRVGKGAHRAIYHAQRQLRLHPWFVQTDVSGYFAHIEHARLLRLLRRRLRGEGLFELLTSLLAGFESSPGCGLPIGSLTSQYFANAYLAPADHYLLAHPACRGHCRYMDDSVAWCASKAEARELSASYQAFLQQELGLKLKPIVLQRSSQGMAFLGCRVHPHRVLPSRRRQRRYVLGMDDLKLRLEQGEIDTGDAQRRADALLAMLSPGRSWHFRRRYLARCNNSLELI